MYGPEQWPLLPPLRWDAEGDPVQSFKDNTSDEGVFAQNTSKPPLVGHSSDAYVQPEHQLIAVEKLLVLPIPCQPSAPRLVVP